MKRMLTHVAFLVTGRVGFGELTIPFRIRWGQPLDLGRRDYWASVIGSSPIADHYRESFPCQCCDDSDLNITYSDLCSKINDVWSAGDQL